MKKYRIFFLAILSTLIFSCSQKKVRQLRQNIVSTIPLSKKKITLNLVGEIRFDRSFNDAQFLSNEKEIDKYYKKQEKSNPVFVPEKNDSLKNKFEQFSIVKNDELLLSKLKFDTKRKFQLVNLSEKPLNIILKQNKQDGTNWKIIITTENDSMELKLPPFMELKYKLLDIVPGGYKEIVLLNENTLSNHELYDFSVYEIKTSD